MKMLRDLAASATFGAVMYGALHAEMPTAEDYQQYNAAIEQCGQLLGGEGRMVETVPAPCEQFASFYQPTSGMPFLDEKGNPEYFLPGYAEFAADYPRVTPTQMTSWEAADERGAEVKSLFFGALVFGGIRIMTRIRRLSTVQTEQRQKAPTWQQRSAWQPNEDAPDYPRAFPNIP